LLDGWFGHTPEAAVIERIEKHLCTFKGNPGTMQVTFVSWATDATAGLTLKVGDRA